MEKKLNKLIYKSPIGDLYIYSNEKTLVGLYINEDKFDALDFCDEVLAYTSEWLDDYFNGVFHTFEMPLKIAGTKFMQAVLLELSSINKNKTISYKDLARLVEMKTGKRVSNQALGTAVGKNPIAIIIPCHRVIKSNGKLGNYHYGVEIKEYLLRLEGLISFKKMLSVYKLD